MQIKERYGYSLAQISNAGPGAQAESLVHFDVHRHAFGMATGSCPHQYREQRGKESCNMRSPLLSRGRIILFLAVVGIALSRNAGAEVPVIVEYSVPSAQSHPMAITAGPDGALWFTGYASGYAGGIGRITTAGDISGYTVPFPPGPPRHTVAITAGTDGALWFTWDTYCDDPSGLSRITTDGVITDRVFSGSSCSTLGVTSGPDGAIWFTNSQTPRSISGNIARVTTDGTVQSRYFVGYGDDCTGSGYPYAGRYPTGITAGPDGALWFTARYWNFPCSYIGRITTAGAITNYPLPPNSNVGLITAGPDGALWFTDTNNIGRITTSGEITEYPIPTPNSRPSHIAAGPDGALWFTEYDANQIGRITTSGEITEYPVPTPISGVSGITTGPDGAIWFTEYAANKIGRLIVVPSTIPELIALVLDPPPGLPAPLTSGQQYSLIAKLNAVRVSLNHASVFPACNKLDAFIFEVNSLALASLVDPGTATRLVAGAQAVERTLACSP
jgi:virginiamycin B lyase